MSAASSARLRFTKMHGAGNDFVVIDRRDGAPWPSARTLSLLADRHFGVGCDQILSIEPEQDGRQGYDIRNADGSAAGQCGNGARCVAAWLWRDGAVSASRFELNSPAGVIEVERLPDGRFQVGLAIPRFGPAAVGLRNPGASLEFRGDGSQYAFRLCSLGNPHALVEVEDLDEIDHARVAAALRDTGRFSDGVNVGFAQLMSPHHIRLRVNERGVGDTLACGSGACAAAALLIDAGRARSPLRVDMPGGVLELSWSGPGERVYLAGPAKFVFEGELDS